jgi:hypothetical protein
MIVQPVRKGENQRLSRRTNTRGKRSLTVALDVQQSSEIVAGIS